MVKGWVLSLYDQGQWRMSALITLLQHTAGSTSKGNKARKWNERYIEQKELKLSLFIDDMMVYIENPKRTIKKSW